ncbi:unnamed protein product [Ambrosiozyma monospora]|uniref:Unnamed protein product n=1 Tax=Ambrosiozyma monospora TaxID=43982 RepID=A0A9W6YZJ1_AMBMO|nr:unnamed protein product [Ambrosiozyma monospora]
MNIAGQDNLGGSSANKEDDDLWLYDDNDDKSANDSSLTNSKFRITDSLINLGPMSDFTMGKVSINSKIQGLPNPNLNEEAIVASSGLEANGSLSIIHPSIKPKIKYAMRFSAVDKLWTLKDSKGSTQYLIITDYKDQKTQIFVVPNKYRLFFSKDFNDKQHSIQFGTMTTRNEKKIVQVLGYKVILYNFKFKKLHSIDYAHEINSATIYDKYVIVIMKNGEIDVLELLEDEDQFEKMDLPALLNYLIFTNGWITESPILNHVSSSSSKKKSLKRSRKGALIKSKSKENLKTETTFWMVTADNRLLVFKKKHKEKVFELQNIHQFPKNLKLSPMDPSYEADVDPLIKQAIFTKLGDEYVTKDYLMILTYGGEVIMYEMYFDPNSRTYKFFKINEICRFPTIGAPDNSYNHATKIERNLIKLDNLHGKQCVFASGASSFLISKMHGSFPRLQQFSSKPVLYFASFNGAKCENGFVTVDDKKGYRACELDLEFMDYSNTLPIKKVNLGETVNQIEYYAPANLYVCSVLKKVEFKALDEEGEPLSGCKKNVQKAMNFRGSIKIISPKNWSVIDTVELDENESCTSLKVMKLKISDSTESPKKTVITVGTGQFKIEDLATNGSWKVYEIISVVPDPNRPEAKYKLKSITSETLKGPISAICEISGRFASVQGQRMLVRTMKSDGNVAPVAFTDTSIYTKDIKSFMNLVLIGDSYQSVSLHGFDAEPYRMLSLGKDVKDVPVSACDFICFDGQLFVLIADEDSILHLLQYDPYDGESLKGSKLLRRSMFRFNGSRSWI